MNKQQIIDFIVNNDDFELLQARTNRFNPLKVLRMQDYEIRHSNVLAWIFNPNENHNLDDRLLKRFIITVLLKPENSDIIDNYDLVYDIKQSSLMNADIYRELENIDLLIVDKTQKIVVLIENKVYSGEHSNQLQKYYQYVRTNYEDYILIPIFLTLDGIEATHNKYYSASYYDILETLEFITNNYQDRTSVEVIEFINYYLTILKEKYIMDDELKQLCKQIYQNNKDVIDMIYNVGNELEISGAVELFMKSTPEIIPIQIKSKQRQFWFAIDEFLKTKAVDNGNWANGMAICLWFSEYNGKLKLALEVGPFTDPSKRLDFLYKLEEESIKLNKSSKQLGKRYTRIYSRTLNIENWEDPQEVGEGMKKMYSNKELQKMIENVKKAIIKFDW